MNMRRNTLQLVATALLSVFAVSASADTPATVAHVFTFTPAGPAAAVSVAGDFNSWSTTASPMTKAADGGAYTVSIALTPGVHHYKFVVDNKWFNDPSSDTAFDAEDGQGGKNSGVSIGAAAAADAAPAGTVAHAFHYTPEAGTASAALAFVAGDFNGWSTTASPMSRAADGSYSATVNVSPGVHHYKFVVDGKWFNDPGSDKSFDAEDGQGGKNSGFGTDAPAAK